MAPAAPAMAPPAPAVARAAPAMAPPGPATAPAAGWRPAARAARWQTAAMRRRLLALAAVVPVATLVALVLALQGEPRVPVEVPSAAATGRSLAALRAQDPRRLPPGTTTSLVLRAQDVQQLLNRASERWGPIGWRVRLGDGTAEVAASAALRGTPWWLNVDATLRQTDGLPALQRWRVGALPLPAWAGEWALRALAAPLDHGLEAGMARELVRRVEMRPDRLRIVYVWRGDLVERLRAALLPPAELARLQAHAGRLADLGPSLPPGGEVALEQLLAPLFELARQRSAAGEDARQENRAAILALALVAEGRDFGSMSPAARDWPKPPRVVVTLGGRHDLARHFLIAALLAFEGGEPLADTMSLAKEVDDLRFGSGFSFTDLAAGRAGARFATLAIDSPRRLQAAVAGGVAGADLLPEVGDLPEFLSPGQFKRRFGDIGSPAYRATMALVDQRIAALPLAERVEAMPHEPDGR
jgi:hypothetical protein